MHTLGRCHAYTGLSLELEPGVTGTEVPLDPLLESLGDSASDLPDDEQPGPSQAEMQPFVPTYVKPQDKTPPGTAATAEVIYLDSCQEISMLGSTLSRCFLRLPSTAPRAPATTAMIVTFFSHRVYKHLFPSSPHNRQPVRDVGL
ncbi:uncharacterized protein LOC143823557 [Paroedura picta]|uniref:uncharacterized protein LOC143823557 n=1 Tax=Paroedura picta TaxID=143630 RepID=UPI004056510C